MRGLHLTADLAGCTADQPLMLDPAALRALCLHAVAEAGLGAVAELFHRFVPATGQPQGGITGVVLLAESHLAVHTWPELGAVTLDVYVCNLGQDNSSKAEALLSALQRAFGPTEAQVQRLERGSTRALLSPSQ
ncbi:MAG: adenosylmethionine decarboxylase [Paucibacter sp.]|nr:adenosylmethionine decarboxylase [Roseateles sp.]